MTIARQPAGIPVGGQFAAGTQSRAAVSLVDVAADDSAGQDVILPDGFNLTTAEPPQVDERIAEIYGRYYQALDKAEAASGRVKWYQGTDFRGRRRGSDEDIAEAEAQRDKLYAAAREVLAETDPYEEEFKRRGGWTRAYHALTNSGGHIHSSMHCSTCNNGEYATRFQWITEASGQDEAQIVSDAGSDACTTCYKSAPTLPSFGQPSKYKSPSQVEKEQRAAEREEKRQAKLAKALLDPKTGQLLRAIEMRPKRNRETGELTYEMREGRDYSSEIGASREALSDLGSAVFYGKDHPSRPGWEANAVSVANAIGAKHGQDPRAILDEWREKAIAKDKRERKQYGNAPHSGYPETVEDLIRPEFLAQLDAQN